MVCTLAHRCMLGSPLIATSSKTTVRQADERPSSVQYDHVSRSRSRASDLAYEGSIDAFRTAESDEI